jgi:hypothetical protein
MAELTEEERAKLPDSAFADPEHRAYPIHDEAHAKAALARVKQHGTKDEQKKVAKKVHERYPQINLGTYFMALLGLAIVGAVVGTWIKDSHGHYHFVRNTPTNRAPSAMADHHVHTRANVPPRNAAQAKPPHAPRPPLNASRQGKITKIRNVGLARTGHLPCGRIMGGLGRMGGFGGFGRR